MEARTRAPASGAAEKAAGGLLTLVGVLNAAFGLLGLTSDAVRLAAGTSAALLAAGAATAVAGILVWRGNAPMTRVALTVFGLLLLVQLGDLIADLDDPGAAASRSVVLLLLVASLGLAVLLQRRRADRPPR